MRRAILTLLFLTACAQGDPSYLQTTQSASGPWATPVPGWTSFRIGFNIVNPSVPGFGSCFNKPLNQLVHSGEDWANNAGTPVRAIGSGTVVYAANANYPGWVIVIRHDLDASERAALGISGSTIYSQYGHLTSVLVSAGQTVGAGQQIASVLDQSSNSHLHWEVRTVEAPALCGFNDPGPGYTDSGTDARNWGYMSPSGSVNALAGAASIPPCGTGLFCAANQIPGSSACTANAQTIFCCPSGQTIVNGACSGTSGTCNGTVAAGNWTGRYWNNTSLSGTPVLTRDDGAGSLNFDWGTGSPGAGCGVPVDNFSARWTRSVSLAAGTYRFSATADDGVRLWVDGVLRIDRWIDQGPTTYTADVTLGAGSHNLQMDYYEHGGGAVARLSWSTVASTSPFCSANCGGGGWWCANDGGCIVNGVAGHNYHCPGNNVAPDRDQACANGCVIAPAGSPDYCGVTSFCGGGSWCGNDCVNGYPRTLYTFTSSGAISSVTQCEVGFPSQTCTIAPPGSPDHCN